MADSFMGRSSKITLDVLGRELQISNIDRVLFPATGFTKAQAIDYYIRVSHYMLPHLKNRPLTLKLFPEREGEEPRYLRDAPAYTPQWIKRAPVWRKSGASQIQFLLVDDLPSLVWTAANASIEMHPFLAKAPKVGQPTMIVFDLDPGPSADVLQCARVGLWLKDVFDRLRLETFIKCSGAKGLHLYVPLNTPITYEETQPFAKAVAEYLERQHPEEVVSEMAKELRHGKVFIDWSQNAAHKSTVCVHSLRSQSDRPCVSAPLTWSELADALEKQDSSRFYWEPEAALNRLENSGDPFAPLLKIKQKLPLQVSAALMKVSENHFRVSASPAVILKKTTKTAASNPAIQVSDPIGLLESLKRLPRAVPKFIKPMYAKTATQLPIGPEWIYEAQWEGLRVIAVKRNGRMHLYSSDGNATNSFPKVVAALKRLPIKTGVLDGQITRPGTGAGASEQAPQEDNPETGMQIFYVFDLINYEDRDLRRMPLHERKAMLLRLMEGAAKPVRFTVPFDVPPSPLTVTENGPSYQSVVAKRRDSFYESGRKSGAWLEIKIR